MADAARDFTLWGVLESHFRPLSIVLSMILLFGAGMFLARFWGLRGQTKLSYPSSDGSATTSAAVASPPAPAVSYVAVDVSGAVRNPGVYQIDSGFRVVDAIESAGGFTDEADLVWVSRYLNLAGKLSDGSKVYIPKVGESSGESSGAASSFVGLEDVAGNKGCPSKVNINTASAQQLDDCLTGIGSTRAQAIISYRSGNPFDSIEEIMEVSGIGVGIFERIQGLITVQ